MNTIIDLNAATTVTYNEESSYSITFGTNFGNTTSNVDAYTSANITNQCNVTALSNAVRDLLIDVAFSNVGNVSVAYDGTFGNIGVLQIAPAAWRVTGIRTTGQYTEAMANVKYTDLTGASNVTPEYSYTTTVNDQAGNTRTWTTTVDVLVQPELAVSGPVIYDEDISANVTVLSVIVDPASLVPFTVYANVAAANGTVSNGIVVGNSVSISGNATQLNGLLTANTITFTPASDLVSNVANAIQFALYRSNVLVDTAAANIQIANTHGEYSLTTAYNYTEDQTVSMVFAITDLDSQANISYVSTFTQTSGNTSQFYVNGVAQGYGNSAVLANTKANINVANVSFLPYPDSTANVGLVYSQIKITPTGNIIQASNVAITLTNTSSHADFTFPVGNTYAEDTLYNFGNTITDTDIRAQNYTIQLQQTSGNIGKFYRNGSLVGFANSALTITNTKANINNTVSWLPPIDYTGNISFTYNQSKVDVFGNTIVQASNVVGNLTNSGTNPEISNMINRSYTSNTTNQIFANSTPYINDGPDYGQTYTITLNSSLGYFGNSAPNAILSNTYSFTGNMTATNAEFANIVFVPTPNTSSSGNFVYTQSRDGVSQVNNTLTLTGTAGPLPASVVFENNQTTPRTVTWTPTFDQSYYGNLNVLLVGGGGGGGAYSGGGGGGGVRELIGVTRVFGTNYSLTIGQGGREGNNTRWGAAGGNTTGFGFTAGGGAGGRNSATPPDYTSGAGLPGQSGSPQNNSGGSSSGNYSGIGSSTGGGGGAGGPGTTDPGTGRQVVGGVGLNTSYTSGNVGSGGSGVSFSPGPGINPTRWEDTPRTYGHGGQSGPSSGAGAPGVIILKFV